MLGKCLGASLLMSSLAYAQIEKTTQAYAFSLDKEKKANYFGAAKNIEDLGDTLTSYESNLRLGWLYYKAGREKRSMRFYKNAIGMNPKCIEARMGFAFPAYLLEDMSELIEQDQKILEIDPNNKTTNGNLGLIYYYNKEYARALPYIQKVVQMYPFDYDNNLTLANIYLKLDKKAEAEKYFNIVLLYAPSDASAKEGLEALGKITPANVAQLAAFAKSYSLSDAQNYKGALEALKSAYDKESYFMNLRMGWLAYSAGQHPDAINYYKQAIALEPNSIEARLGSALPVAAMGNKNELKAIYEAILAIDPQNTVVNYRLGYIYYSQKDYAAALPYFEKVYTLFPFDYDGLLMYAWANYQTAHHSEARALFVKVLCLSPNDSSALQGLSLKPVSEQQQKTEILKPR